MSVTFAFTLAASLFPQTVGLWFSHPVVSFFSITGLIIGTILLICYPQYRKTVPINYILLLLVTVCVSCAVASIGAQSDPLDVLLAMFGTTFASVGLYFAALHTKQNVNLVFNMIIGLCIASVVHLITVLCLFSIFGIQSTTTTLVSSVLLCLIFGGFIMVDFFMILVPGTVDKDDYIMAALNLYCDIVRLFVRLLIILASKK